MLKTTERQLIAKNISYVNFVIKDKIMFIQTRESVQCISIVCRICPYKYNQ